MITMEININLLQVSAQGWDFNINYRGADKSLARPGRKQANVSVRMA